MVTCCFFHINIFAHEQLLFYSTDIEIGALHITYIFYASACCIAEPPSQKKNLVLQLNRCSHVQLVCPEQFLKSSIVTDSLCVYFALLRLHALGGLFIQFYSILFHSILFYSILFQSILNRIE